jgi:NADPH2:quinone reductase
MKAIVMTGFGGPEVFTQAEVPYPELKSGHVIAKVTASSLNPLEIKIRSGLAAGSCPPLPAVLNMDFSGTIVEVGSGVSGFKAGDEVFGIGGGVGKMQGALAEFVLADADLIALKPGSISHETAALYPLVSITAWEALMDGSALEGAEKVLIHGITGGVGHIAAQMAKMAGSRVYGTVTSSDKVSLAREFGADEVIIAGTETPEEYKERCTGGEGFDLVFDTVGGQNLSNSFSAAKIKGTVMTTNGRVSLDLSPMHQKALTLKVVFMALPLVTGKGRKEQGEILRNVAKLIDEGKLIINKDERAFYFDEIGDAHRYFEDRKAKGKISLVSRF